MVGTSARRTLGRLQELLSRTPFTCTPVERSPQVLQENTLWLSQSRNITRSIKSSMAKTHYITKDLFDYHAVPAEAKGYAPETLRPTDDIDTAGVKFDN